VPIQTVGVFKLNLKTTEIKNGQGNPVGFYLFGNDLAFHDIPERINSFLSTLNAEEHEWFSSHIVKSSARMYFPHILGGLSSPN